MSAPSTVRWVRKALAGAPQKLGRYPDALRERLAADVRRPRLWVHAVSVGEVNAARPLIQALQPLAGLVLTTTTATGQAVAQAQYPTLPVAYFPWDFPGSVAAALETFQPDGLLLMETELWPGVIQAASRRGPVCLVNGRLSARSFAGYRRLGALMRPMMRRLTAVWAQTEADAERFQALGAPRVEVMGNLKFDCQPSVDPERVATLRAALGWSPADPVLVLASTHPGEESQLVAVYQSLAQTIPGLRLILAPRHPERGDDVAGLLAAQGIRFFRKTQLPSVLHGPPPQALLLDTVGDLLTAFGLGRAAVMGGSFIPHGGQNPLEPLALGLPVACGPQMFNFAAITQQLVKAGAMIQVASADELPPILAPWLATPSADSPLLAAARGVMTANQGSTQRVLQAIREVYGLPDAAPVG